MKKILMAAMTLLMAVFASCSNDEAPIEGNKELKINFTVADKPGFDGDTRAVKRGWEVGDEIMIIFAGKTYWFTDTMLPNYIKLKNTESGWIVAESELDATNLHSQRYFTAVHHPGTIEFGDYVYSGGYASANYKGGELLKKVNGRYEVIDGTAINVGVLQLQRDTKDFSISVRGLASAGKPDGTWKLYMTMAGSMYFYHAGSICINEYGFSSSFNDYSTGINYGDDVVFYFSNWGCTDPSLKFVLSDGTNRYKLETTTIPVGGKSYYLPEITDPRWTKQ